MNCKWKNLGDFYETSCDNAFEISSGTPKENGMRFCPYCGEKIKEVKP